MEEIHLLTVGWNNFQYNQNLLSTIRDTVNLPITVIFVDNGSTDQTPTEIPKILKYMEQQMPACSTLYHKEPVNKQFAGGFNVALNLSKELSPNPEKFIVLINNDTEFSPNTLENLIACYQKAPLGIDSNHQLQPGQKIGYVCPTTNATANTGQKRENPTSPLHTVFENGKYKYVADGNCPFLFIMAKQKMYDDIGLLDEQFLNSFDDSDYNERLRRANYVSYIDSTTWIKHYGSKSVWNNPNYVKEFEDSHNRFNLKHWNIPIPTKP